VSFTDKGPRLQGAQATDPLPWYNWRMPSEFKVQVGAAKGPTEVTVRTYPAADPDGPCLILGHGAGTGHDSDFMVSFAAALAGRGIETVTFNFPYTEQKRKVPDRAEVVEACWLSVAAAVRTSIDDRPLFAGGKSMGGRIASQVAARAEAGALGLRGLVFLGYPLHPPGRLDQLRVAHWPTVRLPALFVQGERDAFGTPDELREHLPSYGGRADLLVVEGGDHSLKPRRDRTRGTAETYAWIQDEIVSWIGRQP
jgi:predicted alpha/beta-hydrolase family hydrolase